MEAIWQSLLVVAITEMGDKTQLLALVLAAKFKQPWTVMAGILVATVLNHLLASTIGVWLTTVVSADVLRWVLALGFILFALWVLKPDKDEDLKNPDRFGAFVTTLVAFFIAEMGDKTQLSTVAMAAKYQSVALVTVGTTMGMLISDGLAVAFGEGLTKRIPMKVIRWVAALMFVAMGVGVFYGPMALN